MKLVTHCYHGTLAEYLEAKKGDDLDPEGLYLVSLPSGNWTLFIGTKPLELYTEPPQ